jgi:hypothetical protein
MEAKKRLQRAADRRKRPDLATPELWDKVEAAHATMSSCGIVREWEEEVEEQESFGGTCHERWCSLSQGDAEMTLVEAREGLFEADNPRFTSQYWEGFLERRAALSGPLSVLKQAGERGVLHLAAVMTTDSWANSLAADALAEMPSGPLRDRAIVEALFLVGDFTTAAGDRAAHTIPAETRWSLFEEVARTAQRDGVELQSLFWTSLFEEESDDEYKRRPTPDLERAALLLYDLGHHAALAAGLDFLLEPMVSGGERVERVLRDGGIARALETMSRRPPALRPKRFTDA